MIRGKITADKEAVVELEVFGLTRRKKIAVVADTGFTGHLLLPNDFINSLGLRRAGHRYGILGDGNIVAFQLYRAKVLWHGEEREVPVLGVRSGSLVGMSLLHGSRLTLDVVPDGDVTITLLP